MREKTRKTNTEIFHKNFNARLEQTNKTQEEHPVGVRNKSTTYVPIWTEGRKNLRGGGGGDAVSVSWTHLDLNVAPVIFASR